MGQCLYHAKFFKRRAVAHLLVSKLISKFFLVKAGCTKLVRSFFCFNPFSSFPGCLLVDMTSKRECESEGFKWLHYDVANEAECQEYSSMWRERLGMGIPKAREIEVKRRAEMRLGTTCCIDAKDKNFFNNISETLGVLGFSVFNFLRLSDL